jgi:uncharacterized membrane protein YjjB (DUF3815 family)
MTVKINWALLGSVLTALAGVAGSVLTPLYGTGLSNAVSVVLQSLAALLVLIPGLHMTQVAAANAKANSAARLAQAETLTAQALQAQVAAHQQIAAFAPVNAGA